MKTTRLSNRMCTPWETSSGSLASARFRWNKGASPPPERLACRRIPTRELSLRHLYDSGNFFHRKTEEQLTEEGVPYEVGMAFFREIARGQIRGDTTGRLKLLFDPSTKELLAYTLLVKGPRSSCTSGRRFSR